ncbi:uncharacterized protein TNCV_2760971 [Trichonephila clavipes]|nr:uncharacterized protein TNCV_2760971 [Trichonephila clavipes]
MDKECVHICNEQTTCIETVSLFSIRQTGCRKLQHDESVRPSSSTTEITTARIGEMIQNDRRVNLCELLSELGLSYDSVQHISMLTLAILGKDLVGVTNLIFLGISTRLCHAPFIGHIKSITFQQGRKVFPEYHMCEFDQTSPNHILNCLNFTIDEWLKGRVLRFSTADQGYQSLNGQVQLSLSSLQGVDKGVPSLLADQTRGFSRQTDRLIGSYAHAPQPSKVMKTELGSIGLGPNGLLLH